MWAYRKLARRVPRRHLDVSHLSSGRARGRSTAPLRNQLADLGHEIARDVHDRFGRLNTSFVFQECVLVALLLVVRRHKPHFVLSPFDWKSYLTLLFPPSSSAICREWFPRQFVELDHKHATRSESGTYRTHKCRTEAVWPRAVLEPLRPVGPSPAFSKTSITSSSRTCGHSVRPGSI
jgi:hypothetical protein